MGVHREALGRCFGSADRVFLYRPKGLDWDLDAAAARIADYTVVADDIDQLVSRLVTDLRSGDHVVIMSNGAFGGIHGRLLEALSEEYGTG
jgi:UDP-N-acetylmuramate: L-alanyl-gamma-D-glutamyl-meso-diaminopimelate ligase